MKQPIYFVWLHLFYLLLDLSVVFAVVRLTAALRLSSVFFGEELHRSGLQIPPLGSIQLLAFGPRK